MPKSPAEIAGIGRHLASLNLFVEADGKFYITVAGGDTTAIVKEAERVGVREDGEWPEAMARKLVALAENLPTTTSSVKAND